MESNIDPGLERLNAPVSFGLGAPPPARNLMAPQDDAFSPIS
jgi:hypothetical protein